MELARTFVTSDGATLAYRLWRPGHPRRLMVFVHGLASNHTRWTEFVATTALRESWDLLWLDLRGFGGSLWRGPVGLDEWCGDLKALLAVEASRRAVLVGHCLGANVALHFALRDPTATQGLVLIEPMFRPALRGPLRAATRLRPIAAALAVLVRRLNGLGVRRRRLESLDLAQLDRDARAAMAAAGPAGFPERRYGSPLEDLKFTPLAVYLASLVAIATPPPPLRGIPVPALALLSRGGRYGDPAMTATVVATLPRCEVQLLDARHWIPTECPTEMRQAIEAWCDRLSED